MCVSESVGYFSSNKRVSFIGINNTTKRLRVILPSRCELLRISASRNSLTWWLLGFVEEDYLLWTYTTNNMAVI